MFSAAGDIAGAFSGGGGGGGASAATSGGGTGLGGSFGGPSGSGQFSSQVSQFNNSNSGGYSLGQYGTNVSSQFGSDRKLKNNIKLISKSKSGLNIYSFNYKDDKTWGNKTYQGVMSDEIPTNAVIKHEDGFDRVDYSKIDVEFKSI